MRLVVDTNVLVAGILSASGPPGWIVEALLSGEIEPVLDAQIRAEYKDVLRRPELSLDPGRVVAVLDVIDAFGLEVVAPLLPAALPDPDDAPFLAVAALARCPLVTGNIRHFPAKARGDVAADTTFSGRIAALVGGPGQAHERTDLPAVLEFSPGELPGTGLGADLGDAAQSLQTPSNSRPCGARAGRDPLVALAVYQQRRGGNPPPEV